MAKDAKADLLNTETTAQAWADAFNGGSRRAFGVMPPSVVASVDEPALGADAGGRTLTCFKAPEAVTFCTKDAISLKIKDHDDSIGEFEFAGDAHVTVNGDGSFESVCSLLRVLYTQRQFFSSLTHGEWLAALARNGAAIVYLHEFRRANRSTARWEALHVAAVSENAAALFAIPNEVRTTPILYAAFKKNCAALRSMTTEQLDRLQNAHPDARKCTKCLRCLDAGFPAARAVKDRVDSYKPSDALTAATP